MLLGPVVDGAHALLDHGVLELHARYAGKGFAALHRVAILKPVILAVPEHSELLVDIDTHAKARPVDLALPLLVVDRSIEGVTDEIDEGRFIIDRHEGLHRAPAFLARKHSVERRDEQRDADIGALIRIDDRLADRGVTESVSGILDFHAR